MHTVKNTRFHAVQYPKNMWISGSISSRRRLQVQEFNDVITCYLCRGYLINPTTIDNCIHSYCRSCIVQYLQRDNVCPQCRPGGGKHVSLANLKSDEVLRSLVFKLVPGIYQQERDNMVQFSSSLKPDDLTEGGICELEDEFFSPAEPISLSLEYHPALLTSCGKDEIPKVRYLQCPAGVMIHHLKRFLCSKYDIDPENRQVEIEIIYEEEVLPSDFTLMDVGYCYNWRRNGPMRFRYRILIHRGITQDVAEIHPKSETSFDNKLFKHERLKDSTSLPEGESNSCKKAVRFTDERPHLSTSSVNSLPPPMTYTVFKSKAQEFRLGSLNSNNNNNNNSKVNNRSPAEREFDENMLNEGNGPVKVIIARKPAENRKNSPKLSHASEETSYVVANDFKSLRSNDLRYSDYTVTSTTSSNYASRNKEPDKSSESAAKRNQIPKCDIVVSIPQFQLSRSASSSGESATISQLKTANKKSPTSSHCSKPKNVPKLKIELGSLKTKITIPKPKSADVSMPQAPHKKSKHRKYSVDDYGPTADRVDLETYAKNIGLKPIEVVTAPEALESVEKDKYSPDASPMSSSSSTTSSSNGNFVFTSSSEITSSSHKKRKKKHSRDPKDSNGKRRKLHAEISSQPADESLKMKVKITASHGHKTHRTESRKAVMKNTDPLTEPLDVSSNDAPKPKDPRCDTTGEDNSLQNINNGNINGNSNNNNNNNSALSANMCSLNETLSEESLNISNLMIGQQSSSVSIDEAPPITTSTHSDVCSFTKPTESVTLSPKPPLPKPISSIKDIKIPSSPPLPPSLFKTTPLTLTTTTALSASAATKTAPNLMSSYTAKPAQKIAAKPPSPVQPQNSHASGIKTNIAPAKTQSFAVPNPPRSMPNTLKLCSLPTSIASAAHKQMGAQLKRSASLDESYAQNSLARQQEKLVRKNTYGNALVPTSVRSNNIPQKECTLLKLKSAEKPFYSTISSAYTHDLSKRKALPMNLPPAPMNVSKINETYSIYTNPRVSTQPALTITTHPKQTAAQQLISFLPYTPLSKPAHEIVRVASNQVPADMQPPPPKSPPKRPAQPPIPLLKIKKPGQQSAPKPSAPIARPQPVPVATTSGKTSHPVQKSPPALINMRNTIPLTVATKATSAKETMAKISEDKSNGSAPPEKPKGSLRDFRPTSKDGSVEILDLSANKSQDSLKPSQVQTTIGNSLEAALNKIKQNITSCTVMESCKLNAAKSTSEDLQNLHMLSESATSREKIAIKTPQKLFEMPKSTQPSMVRPQNASVRNIPNPSALAFRNQPSLSIQANAASPPTPQLQPTSSATIAEAKSLSPPSSFVSSPRSPNTPSLTSPRVKKHTSIDQVAANLNIRAAAAEAEATAAKAASLEESSLVSSSSVPELKPAVGTLVTVTAADTVSTNVSSCAAISSTTTITSSTAVVATCSSDSAEILTMSTTSSPSMPKTSFRSISSLVATTSAPSAVASSV